MVRMRRSSGDPASSESNSPRFVTESYCCIGGPKAYNPQFEVNRIVG
jgi:hypothetical protein